MLIFAERRAPRGRLVVRAPTPSSARFFRWLRVMIVIGFVMLVVGFLLYADAYDRGGVPPGGCPPESQPAKGANVGCFSLEGQLGWTLTATGFSTVVVTSVFYVAARVGERKRAERPKRIAAAKGPLTDREGGDRPPLN